MMMEWGLDPEKDADKICRIPGGYVQKRNVDLLHQTMERHDAEMTAAIEGDQTGEDFIYEMFLYELDNHEYGYTMDAEDTLDALGYTSAQVLEDPRLKRGLEKAAAEIRGREND